ncbi:MAG: hypothetical protein AAF353_00060 [Pseudomonadota bacterium]
MVVPLGGDSVPINLENIVTVAKDHGDFEDPVAAVDSISGKIDLKPHLHLIGSGKRLTMLEGSFDAVNGEQTQQSFP